MRGRTVRHTRRRRQSAGREGLLELPGSDEAGRWWLDRVGDESGSSGESSGRLDPASGSHGEDRHPRRRHGREGLERIMLDCTGARGMAGAPGESRARTAHAGHRVRGRAMALEQAERRTGRRRLGQQEGGQRGESEAAGAQGLEHHGSKVIVGAAGGQRIDAAPTHRHSAPVYSGAPAESRARPLARRATPPAVASAPASTAGSCHLNETTFR